MKKAVIRVQVAGLLGREPLLVALWQVERQRVDNLLRNVVLYGKDIGQVAIEALRPQMSARGRVNKLRGDTYPVARCPPARNARRGSGPPPERSRSCP